MKGHRPFLPYLKSIEFSTLGRVVPCPVGRKV
jgi:hypothetical protein